jgi:hypothetical protein
MSTSARSIPETPRTEAYMAIYEVQLPARLRRVLEGRDLEFDDPRLARRCIDRLQREFGVDQTISVLRDKQRISDGQLSEDERSFEVAEVREGQMTLPAGYQKGWTDNDDVSSDGRSVKRPRNPE